VHEEWIRAVLRDNPHIQPARLHALRDAMDERIDDAVVTGYDSLIETLTLSDPNDRHVLAAAIIGDAKIIVTRNLRDFPEDILAVHKIQAMHPDAFISGLLDWDAAKVVDAVRDQQASLKNPPISLSDLLSLFERLALIETAAELRRLMAA
jgi:hypothetical protein